MRKKNPFHLFCFNFLFFSYSFFFLITIVGIAEISIEKEVYLTHEKKSVRKNLVLKAKNTKKTD